MSERPDIAAAVEKMPTTIGAGRELKALPDELSEGETVAHIVSGQYAKGNGILVATDRRLLFIHKGLVKATTEDFTYARVNSVEYKSGMALATITISASGKNATIKNLTKAEAKAIADYARPRLGQQGPAQTSTGPHDELLKLKQLHDAGVIDDATYDAKSAPLISQI